MDERGPAAGWGHIFAEVPKLPGIRQAVRDDTRAKPVPPPASTVDDTEAVRLLEVKVGASGEAEPHRSRAVLMPVSEAKKRALMIDLRARGDEPMLRESSKTHVYPDPKVPEITDHATGPVMSSQPPSPPPLETSDSAFDV